MHHQRFDLRAAWWFSKSIDISFQPDRVNFREIHLAGIAWHELSKAEDDTKGKREGEMGSGLWGLALARAQIWAANYPRCAVLRTSLRTSLCNHD